MSRETYRVQVCGLTRELPLFEVSPGVRIAVFNILGDVELTRAAGAELATRLAAASPEVVVTAETKSVPLAYEIATRLAVPYVVFRKGYKSYMGDALAADTLSITTGAPQTLYLDEKDRSRVDGRRVAIVDDVVSTGSTLKAMRDLVQRARGTVVGEAAIFTEGDALWDGVVALGHLPVFRSRLTK
jgi:adenine/guanine phosphoribosyltransferase-like PRPP-binding protein